MGDNPQDKGITVGFDCQFEVHLKDSSPGTLPAAFGRLLLQLSTDLIQKVLVGFGGHVMAFKEKPLAYRSYCNNREFSWKTRHGEKTKIHALAAGGLQTLRGQAVSHPTTVRDGTETKVSVKADDGIA